MEWVATDVTRKLLAGIDPFAPADASMRRGIYHPAHTRATMRALLLEARALLAAGRPVVLDGTFQRRTDRDAVRRLGRRLGVPVRFVLCEAPPAVIRARLAGRRGRPSISDARWAIFLRQREAFEPWTEIAPDALARVDTRAPMATMLKRLDSLLAPLAGASDRRARREGGGKA
jgi:hypothetical protein